MLVSRLRSCRPVLVVLILLILKSLRQLYANW